MKITLLIDNTPAESEALKAEHGLSFYIEADGQKILCDTGASPLFLENARHLGIDLSVLDFAFISHGHADHAGGLPAFMERFPSVLVYLSQQLFAAHYYSYRHESRREISPDFSLPQRYPARFRLLAESAWITPNIAAVYNRCDASPRPWGNKYLAQETQAGEELDPFRHEMSLAFKTDKGLVVISSCSHNGAINIMDSCRQFTGEDTVYAFVGGLHFVDSEHTEHEVLQFARDFRARYAHTILYTGHCTGAIAKEALMRELPQTRLFRTGLTFTL